MRGQMGRAERYIRRKSRGDCGFGRGGHLSFDARRFRELTITSPWSRQAVQGNLPFSDFAPVSLIPRSNDTSWHFLPEPLERVDSCEEGSVRLDGHDLRDLDLQETCREPSSSDSCQKITPATHGGARSGHRLADDRCACPKPAPPKKTDSGREAEQHRTSGR